MKAVYCILLSILITSNIRAQAVGYPIPLDSIINPSLELSLSEGGWEEVGITSNLSIGSSSNPVPYDGGHLLRISGAGASLRQALNTVHQGHRYRVSAWVYNHGTLGINDLGVDSLYEVSTNPGALWKRISVEFVSTGSPALFYAKYGPGSGKSYFDFFEAADISTTQDSIQNAPVKKIKYPSQILDLSCWKITLPINNAEEIYTPTLYDYSIDPWFKIVHDNDGWAVQYRANHGGATTSGSNNPRSELREMLPDYRYQDSKSAIAWSNTNGTHTMWIKQKVTHLTYVKPHTVVGQIHDASNDISVFRVEGLNGGATGTSGTVGVLDTLAKLWITDGDKTHAYLVDSLYRIGSLFEVKFIAHDGVIEYEYNGKKLPYKQVKNVSGCFFKFGNYTQSNSVTAPNEVDSAYAESYVYDYAITHDNIIGIEAKNEKTIPTRILLEQNYPNPFNPTTIISYYIPETTAVQLVLYDLLGRKIGVLVNETKQAGSYRYTLDAVKNGLSSGIYYYQMKAGDYIKTNKMIYLK